MDTKTEATFNPFQLFFLNLRERFRTMTRPGRCGHCQEVNMVRLWTLNARVGEPPNHGWTTARMNLCNRCEAHGKTDRAAKLLPN